MRRCVFWMLVEWRVERQPRLVPEPCQSQSTPASRVSQASGTRSLDRHANMQKPAESKLLLFWIWNCLGLDCCGLCFPRFLGVDAFFSLKRPEISSQHQKDLRSHRWHPIFAARSRQTAPGQCSPPKALPRLSFIKQRQAFSARPWEGNLSALVLLSTSGINFALWPRWFVVCPLHADSDCIEQQEEDRRCHEHNTTR